MNAHHAEILNEIKERATGPARRGDRYAGTTKLLYPMYTEVSRQIAKDWIKRHPDLTPSAYRRLLTSLSRGESVNEFGFIGDLLRLLPGLRQTLSPRDLEPWLARGVGWAEIDSVCQNRFTADEMLAHWGEWKRLLTALSRSDNVHQRRASLVLLTGAVRHVPDGRLSNLAFVNIERLKREKDILITKAISWLLRDLIAHHRAEVERYLRDHADTLPKIAVRETRVKLATGRKARRQARVRRMSYRFTARMPPSG